MAERKTTRYILQMDNRPGELTKLTRILASEGVDIAGIKIASIGEKASIEFCAITNGDFPKRLKRSGFEARVA